MDPTNAELCLVAPLVVGTLPVARRPRYQAPMSVNWPLPVKKAALGPTLETDDLSCSEGC
jgi:hypothetical protein